MFTRYGKATLDTKTLDELRRLEEVTPDTAELPTITTHEDDTHEAAGPPSPAAGPALGHTSAA